MKISSLSVKNYRRFDTFSIDLDPRLTVVAARNGLGKTTVLEALAVALGPFVGAFDEGRAESIRKSDVRRVPSGTGPENEKKFPVVVTADFTGPGLTSTREKRTARGTTTTSGTTDLVAYGKTLQEQVRAGEAVSLPVISYYSSKRLWVHHNASKSTSVLTKSRTAGYDGCLSPLSSYKQLQNWVKSATLADFQQKVQPRGQTPGAALGERVQGIADAVEAVMSTEGWSGFRYDFVEEELAMFHPDHGYLPMTYLSDGVRAMAALAADLAQRCVQLNGHLGAEAPRQTRGIVLIDEIDLHLHPAWQQQVLPSLLEAFPLVQFVVSTHSPQVLSTVPRECIRSVFQDVDGKWHATTPDRQVMGLKSSVALREIMGVDPIPEVPEARLIRKYTALIENGEQDSAEGMDARRQLEEFYGPRHPVMVDADRLIRFQRIKSRRDA